MDMNYKCWIKETPDFPKKGILFRDISPLLQDGEAFKHLIGELSMNIHDRVQVVLGCDARGFIIGTALAMHKNCGFVMVRKAGKMPPPTIKKSYGLEYGSDTLEIHKAPYEACPCVIADDVLVTGGTAEATVALARQAGYDVKAVVVAVEIGGLGGREKLEKLGVKVISAVQY